MPLSVNLVVAKFEQVYEKNVLYLTQNIAWPRLGIHVFLLNFLGLFCNFPTNVGLFCQK